MFYSLTKYILESSFAKHFIISFVVALGLVFANKFSVLIVVSVALCLLPVIVNSVGLKDKFTYNQKQQFTSTPLLLSACIWSIFMWSNLKGQPQYYTFVFVAIVTSALVVFESIKQKTLIAAPLLLTYIALLVYSYGNNFIILSISIFVLSVLFLLFRNTKININSNNYEDTDKDTDKETANNKTKLTYELGESNIEYKKLQDRFKQMEIDLSAAEMAKMEFLATMSHEIRTPLNGIIPLLDILLDSELSDFQKDYLSTAHVSAIQMQKLIDDLLDYSKVEAGKLTVEISGLKIPKIIEDVKSSYVQAAEKKNITIDVDINKNISPLLRGDPTRFRQVLSNLVSNAIKFSARGTIKIEANKIKDYPDKEVVRFKVIDEGMGMDKETSDNIFLAFTQGDGSSTRKFGGTGLGLAISKNIVELMHGNIYLESKIGVGSTFYFDLPLLKSVGETRTGVVESVVSSSYQAIIVNTNPPLFNRVCQNLKNENIAFQKTLGLSQAYDMYASINKVSSHPKKILLFIDFETAGKHVRTLCMNIANDSNINDLYACVLSDNKNIAGISSHQNIKFISENDSIAELLDKISADQALLEDSLGKENNEKDNSFNPPSEEEVSKVVPEILLVEDNEVNLKVAEKLIQYIGYPFDFAMNGLEALEKVKKTRYRMILMDCQMPIMDGYRCTSKIRDFEEAAKLNHTPILAMTANAMMGDREKCLDAGMDDYMSKPLNRYLLEKTLKKWDPLVNLKENTNEGKSKIKNTTVGGRQEKASGNKIESKLFEEETEKPSKKINQKWLSIKVLAGLEEIMGKETVMLLNMFEQETPGIIKKIDKALENNTYNDIKKIAHKLKSTSANVGANGLSFFSRKLELAAENKDIMQLKGIFSKIKKAHALTSKEISKYLSS